MATTKPKLDPKIEERPEQQYVGIEAAIRIENFNEIADRLPEVLGWVEKSGLKPSGPPFFRYNVINAPEHVDVEACVPVDGKVPKDDDTVIVRTVPAGRYVTHEHVGNPEGLAPLVGAILEWAGKEGLEWDVKRSGDTERWASSIEIYKTEVAIKLAD